MGSTRRSGFSLIELIVVIAILGLLTAVLIPAVQKVREVSNKNRCKDNLGRIGMAAHNYHNDYGHLPPASIGPYWQSTPGYPMLPSHPQGDDGGLDGPFNWNGAHVGCLAILLPYLEQQHLYRQCFAYNWKNGNLPSPCTFQTPQGDQTFSDGNPRWDIAPVGPTGLENRERARTRIRFFHCPSDTGLYDDPRSGFAITTHAYYNTLTLGYWPNSNGTHSLELMREWGRTNYMACVGAIGRGGPNPLMPYGAFEGMITNRSRKTLTHVTNADGTSNSLMYGEATHGPIAAEGGQLGSKPVARDFAFSWMGCGEMATAWGLPPDGGHWYTFGSAHPTTVNFCFGDRSVRGIRRQGIDKIFSPHWWMFMQVSGYKDGFNQNMSALP